MSHNPDQNAPDWCKCRFSAAALHGKTIEFRLRTETGISEGTGKLIAEPGDEGYARVAVQFLNRSSMRAAYSPNSGILASARLEWIGLTQSEVDALVENPSGTECAFKLFVA